MSSIDDSDPKALLIRFESWDAAQPALARARDETEGVTHAFDTQTLILTVPIGSTLSREEALRRLGVDE
jgi:hypothetical protein